MQRFKNILVVIDRRNECEVLIKRAVRLAQRNQARLTVITFSEELSSDTDIFTPDAVEQANLEGLGTNIIEELSPDLSAQITPQQLHRQAFIGDALEDLSPEANIPISWESFERIQKQITKAEGVHLEKIIASIRQAGIQVSGKVLYGKPFLEIIREVLRNEHDLVMIAAEGRIRLREMLFGSSTMHLMRKCPCPVWVFKPEQPDRYTCIMAAVDPASHDEVRNRLNFKILELAASLARREDSELVIIHAWTVFGESRLRSDRADLPGRAVDEIVQGTREAHNRWLTSLLGKLPLEDLQCKVYMLKGEPGNLIPALAKMEEVELILMGTVSRTGVAGLLIGNTAEKVLQRVNCSVLTVKPEEFITPVKLDV